MSIYRDNVLASESEIAKALKNELTVNPEHEAVIIHSKVMDCNPHTKVKFETSDSTFKIINSKAVIFVPSSASQPIEIPEGSYKEIILDIRSCTMEGSKLFTVFRNFISDFSIMAQSPNGKKGKIYMSANEPFILDKPIGSSTGKPIKKPVIVLIDRYTFRASDEYCALIMAYFCKHYRVKGEHFHMYKYIYKVARFPVEDSTQNSKIAFALPVIRLLY